MGVSAQVFSNKEILDSNDGRFIDPEHSIGTPISTPVHSTPKYKKNDEFSRSTNNLRSSLPLVNSARTNFENPNFELPKWAQSIPQYMDPEALRPAKQLRGFLNKRGPNMVDRIKIEDEKILQNRIKMSRNINNSPLYKITYFADGKYPTADLPPAKKR